MHNNLSQNSKELQELRLGFVPQTGQEKQIRAVTIVTGWVGGWMGDQWCPLQGQNFNRHLLLLLPKATLSILC